MTKGSKKQEILDQFLKIPGINLSIARILFEAGYRSYSEIAKSEDEKLAQILGGDSDTVAKIKGFLRKEEEEVSKELAELDIRLKASGIEKEEADTSKIISQAVGNEFESDLEDLDKSLGNGKSPDAPPKDKVAKIPTTSGKDLKRLEDESEDSSIVPEKALEEDLQDLDKELEGIETLRGPATQLPKKEAEKTPSPKPVESKEVELLREAITGHAPEETERDLDVSEKEKEIVPEENKGLSEEISDLDRELESAGLKGPISTPKTEKPSEEEKPKIIPSPQKTLNVPITRTTRAVRCRKCGNSEIDLDRARCTKCKFIIPYSDYKKAIIKSGERVSKDLMSKYERAVVLAELPSHAVDEIIHIDSELNINPQDSDAWFRRGKVLEQNRKYKDALDAYDEALKYSPQHKKSLQAKADVLTKLDRHFDAKMYLEKIETTQQEPEVIEGQSVEEKASDKLAQEVIDDEKIKVETDEGPMDLDKELTQLDKMIDAPAGDAIDQKKISDELAEELEALEENIDENGHPLGTQESEIENEIEQRKILAQELKVPVRTRFTGVLTKTGGIEGSIGDAHVKGKFENYVTSSGNIDGLINGRGRINGIINDRTKFRGLVNGRGRINGIINGTRVKGKINGIVTSRRTFLGSISQEGKINGLTNGKRITGLLTKYHGPGGELHATIDGRSSLDGYINGKRRVMGLINGSGRINGIVNGKTVQGKINGITNGMGRINGLNDGYGKTNGFVSKESPLTLKEKRGPVRARRKFEIAVVTFVIILTMIAGILMYVPAGEKAKISTDGDRGDWSDLPMYSKTKRAIDPNIDLVDYSAFTEKGTASFLMTVTGNALKGASDGSVDTFQIFIDSDKKSSTGYRLAGIGADYRIDIAGKDGAIAVSQLYIYDSSRDSDGLDWGVWAADGGIHSAAKGSTIEAQINTQALGIRNGESFTCYFHSLNWKGEQDYSETVIGPEPGILVANQRSNSDKIVSAGSNVPMLSLDLKAIGADMSITSMEFGFSGSSRPNGVMLDGLQANVSGDTASFTFASPIAVGSGNTESKTVSADLSLLGDESSVGVYLKSIETASGTVQIYSDLENYMKYVVIAPQQVKIDGAFGDWVSGSINIAQTGGKNNPNIDLNAFGVTNESGSICFYIRVDGEMMGGTKVPWRNNLKIVGPPPLAPVDTDRDTVPDDVDLMKFDFNNDGIDDINTNHDVDRDGVKDYPFGLDYYLNTTIPNDFPQPYANKVVSVYIGPPPTGPTVSMPKIRGEDYAYIFIDSDNSSVTGYNIGGLGAEYQVNITGKNGNILSKQLMKFNGSASTNWNWLKIADAVAADKDTRQMELGVPLASLNLGSNASFYFMTKDWAGEEDGLPFRENTFFDRGVPVCELDPFVIRNDGKVYQSDDGSSWTDQSSDLPSGYRYIAITGQYNVANTVYMLRSDGKVYYTTSLTGNWAQYGTGTQPPSGTGYIGIASDTFTAGQVYILRNDGYVSYVTAVDGNWAQYGTGATQPPTSTAYVGITADYPASLHRVYIVRNDGYVSYVSAVDGNWDQFGEGAQPPSSTAYVGITTDNAGTKYILRNDGNVYRTATVAGDWTQYGTGTQPPTGTAYVGIAGGITAGKVYILRNDGYVSYVTASGGNWAQYGTGTQPLYSTSYIGIATDGTTDGQIYIVGNDDNAYVSYVTALAGNWDHYGTGTQPPSTNDYVSIAAYTSSMLFALKNNGACYKSTNSGATWTAFGDAGFDISWVGLALSHNYVYAIRNDGGIERSNIASSGWSFSWGDLGSATSWCCVATDRSNYIYGLKNDGSVVKSSTADGSTFNAFGDAGSDSSWVSITAWSTYAFALKKDGSVQRSPTSSADWSTNIGDAGSDTSWFSLSAADDSTLYALRNDGQIGKYTGSWSSSGDVGSDNSYIAITCLIPECSEITRVTIPIIGPFIVFALAWARNRVRRKRRGSE